MDEVKGGPLFYIYSRPKYVYPSWKVGSITCGAISRTARLDLDVMPVDSVTESLKISVDMNNMHAFWDF
jgi:hypothetical protein